MASVAQLGYLGLDVTSLANWESFATEVLGLQVAANNPDGALCLRRTRIIIGSSSSKGAGTTLPFSAGRSPTKARCVNSRHNCAPTASMSVKPPRTTRRRAAWSN